jgi:hypothetical protein
LWGDAAELDIEPVPRPLDYGRRGGLTNGAAGATEPLEMGKRAFGLAVGRVDVGHRGRIGTTPRSIIPGTGPQLAALGSASTKIEDGCGSLVREQLGRTSHMLDKPLVQELQEPGRLADPVGQRRAVECDALASIDLGLAVKRKMIGVLGHDAVDDQRLGRQAALTRRAGAGIWAMLS